MEDVDNPFSGFDDVVIPAESSNPQARATPTLSKKYQRTQKKRRSYYKRKTPLVKPPKPPKKPKKPKNPERVAHMNQIRRVTIKLGMSHVINGLVYGPGVMSVTRDLARELQNREQHATKIEDEFRGTKGVIIGPRRGGSVSMKLVPIETFATEDTMLTTEPFDTISGKNK